MKAKRSHEPVFWSLFGAGGLVVAFILPVLILITGLVVPLGLLSPETLAYDRIQPFASTWIGEIFIFFVISLSFWHGLHRIFLSLHDLGINRGKMFFKWLCYGLAGLGTLITLVLLAGI